MRNPDDRVAQCNYMVKVFAIDQDHKRAATLIEGSVIVLPLVDWVVYACNSPTEAQFHSLFAPFAAAMKAMVDRGPDIPFVLYSYAIFLATTGREDFLTIQSFVDRARAKDPYGQHYRAGSSACRAQYHRFNHALV